MFYILTTFLSLSLTLASTRSGFFILFPDDMASSYPYYSMTPVLKRAISLYPFISCFNMEPSATASTFFVNCCNRVSMGVPSNKIPALKSSQFFF